MAAPVPVTVPPGYLYTVAEAAVLLRRSRSRIYELIRSGRLYTVKEGNSRLVPEQAIHEFIQLLIRESGVDCGQAS